MSERRLARAGLRTLLAGALALGLVAGGGVAWSYWTTRAAATGTALKSGYLDLTAGPSTGAEQLAGTAGTWAWGDLALTNAFPGESVAKRLVVKNSGTTAMTVTAAVVSGTNALAPYLRLSTVTGGVAANTTSAAGLRSGTCSTGVAGVTDAAVSTTPTTVLSGTTLAAGQTAAVCVVLSLAPTAPSSLQGAQAPTVSVTLNAQQKAR